MSTADVNYELLKCCKNSTYGQFVSLYTPLMDYSLEDKKALFISAAKSDIKRSGIISLLEFLENETDFFIAPASTKYHGACEGGLVSHSLCVYSNFKKIALAYGFIGNESRRESSAIVCLFHDVCKANFYKRSSRNVKDGESGQWVKQPFYTVEEKLPYGSHGGKSVYIVMSHMHLTAEEAMAIHNHMGAWNKSAYEDPGKAYDYSKLAWLLHVADEAATYIDKT